MHGWLWGFAEEMAARKQSEIWLATEVRAYSAEITLPAIS